MRPCNPLGSNLPAVPAKLCPSQVLFSTCGLRAIPLTGGDASGSSLYTALKAAEFSSLPLARASTCESFPLRVCTCSSPCGWNTWYHKNRSSSEVCFAQVAVTQFTSGLAPCPRKAKGKGIGWVRACVRVHMCACAHVCTRVCVYPGPLSPLVAQITSWVK